MCWHGIFDIFITCPLIVHSRSDSMELPEEIFMGSLYPLFCSKISITFLVLFSNKVVVIRA